MAVSHRAGPSRAARSVRWALLGVTSVLAVAAVLVSTTLSGGTDGAATARDTTPASSSPPAAPAPAPASTRAARVAPVSAAARPEHLTIAEIGVSTDLLRLGLNPDRTVQVPQDADLAGWFDQGPAPGRPGSSVLLGHVDSTAGPAVFHRLKELRAGVTLEVRLDDGSVARFEVTRTATYDNEDFPAQEVYGGSTRRRLLNLVTCGGEYDAERGGWQSNVVVFTELVGVTRA
ncbi:class F sortase [Nocardioides sp. 503]|uniref:class F sortase n=1 Tax=Nocardioides sp. 503 TaxID=2508326 RepID=UPI001ADB15B0|nr:class F sortase [Nocardioides sp. 503]